MRAIRRCALVLSSATVCLAVTACGGSSSPTTPTAAPGFPGQWSGTTAQGQPITFAISPDEKVTSISVGYNFNGCSGTQTYSNLAIEIRTQVTCIPSPCPPLLGSQRSVEYGDGNPFQGQYTGIQGILTETQGLFGAEGVVQFRNYPGCGNAQAGWTARRR